MFRAYGLGVQGVLVFRVFRCLGLMVLVFRVFRWLGLMVQGV